MSLVIAGATIVAMDERSGAEPYVGDVIVEGDTIASVRRGASTASYDGHDVLPGRDRIVMPGLVNGHIHSAQNFWRGRYSSLPLELLIVFAYPFTGAPEMSPELIYLRTLLVGMESLKNGVTCILDDVVELPGQTLEQLDAVFRAYADLGIRANVSGHVLDRAYTDSIPFASEVFPSELLDRYGAQPRLGSDEYLSFAREAIGRFHDEAGLRRFVVAPSAPQRCTDELLLGALELAEANGIAYHTHVLETKSQVVTGRELYGKTLIEYMASIGALTERTTIAHAIWVTDRDIELIAEAGAAIVHNPVCNMRIGSGVAPFRKWRDAGIPVALGTDGISSNDTSRMFDVLHITGMLHNLSTPGYTTWPSAGEVLEAATVGGARSVWRQDEIGSIEEGKKADLVVLNARTLSFTPMNDVRNHLVYCENGSSIETVIVNGEIVVREGEVVRVDEKGVIEEVVARTPEILRQHVAVEAFNSDAAPYFAEVHRRCSEEAVGLTRALF